MKLWSKQRLLIAVSLLGFFSIRVAVSRINAPPAVLPSRWEPAQDFIHRSLLQSADNSTVQCEAFHQAADKCAFVSTVPDCQPGGGFINYYKLPFCVMPGAVPAAMIIEFLWLLFLFVALGVTAEEYFCPALNVIADTLKLSDNVAGVTFLALGNGAPDIFSVIASINSNKNGAALAVGELFGAGLFVTTIVTGIVSLISDFKLVRRPFMRDVLFYLLATVLTFILINIGTIHLAEAVVFLLLYIIYVGVVIGGRILYQSWKKRRLAKEEAVASLSVADESGSVTATGESPKVHVVRAYDDHDDTRFAVNSRALVANVDVDSPSSAYQPPTIAISSDSDHNAAGSSSITITTTTSDLDASQDPSSSSRLSPAATATLGVPGMVIQVTSAPNSPPTSPDSVRARLQSRSRALSNRSLRMSFSDAPSRVLAPAPDDDHIITRHHSVSHRPTSTLSLGADLNIPDRPRALTSEIHKGKSTQGTTGYEPLLPGTNTVMPSDAYGGASQYEHFLNGVNPMSYDDFKEAKWYGKVYNVFQWPILLILNLTIPVVDTEFENEKWNRLLNALHLIISPIVFVFIIKAGLKPLGGVFPVYDLCLLIGGVSAVLAVAFSHHHRSPSFHRAFAFLGFLMSVVWIYAIANEIVNLLQTFGLMFHISEALLGLTVLAWGNSIGDTVSDSTMARHGYPNMAIGACYGGPLMNMLLGIGISCLIATLRSSSHSYPFESNSQLFVDGIFLIASLACTAVFVPLNKWRTGRKYGIFLIVLYVVSLGVAVGLEFS